MKRAKMSKEKKTANEVFYKISGLRRKPETEQLRKIIENLEKEYKELVTSEWLAK